MPDLVGGRYAFHHTLDSALNVLSDFRIPPNRVTIAMAGFGWPTSLVVGQDPPAGAPVTPDRSITLHIAGAGLFSDLPAGMWERGGEAQPGTEELVGLFDDPLQKMAHWIREGGPLFDVRRDNLAACARWLALFGIAAEDWPADLRYDLAILMPSLHRLAGKQNGIRFIFGALLNLPLLEIRRQPRAVYLADSQCSRLGRRMSRLGVDLIAGDRREDLTGHTLVFGPVTLLTYCHYRDPYYEKLLHAVAALAMPCYRPFQIEWSVLDANHAVRLGRAHQNGVLGVNSHLGRLPYHINGVAETTS
jgi:hypothetical protein